MTPEAQAAFDMRERCVELLHQRIREWLRDNGSLPEEDQVGYPPYTLMEAANAMRALPVDVKSVTTSPDPWLETR